MYVFILIAKLLDRSFTNFHCQEHHRLPHTLTNTVLGKLLTSVNLIGEK